MDPMLPQPYNPPPPGKLQIESNARFARGCATFQHTARASRITNNITTNDMVSYSEHSCGIPQTYLTLVLVHIGRYSGKRTVGMVMLLDIYIYIYTYTYIYIYVCVFGFLNT